MGITIKKIMCKVVLVETSLIVTLIKLNLNMMIKTNRHNKSKLIKKSKKKRRGGRS